MKTKLFHLAIVVMITLATSSLIFSQNNITNTLGTGGTFTIKDGLTTFFTIDQSDGRITLPITTGPSIGVIFKGADKFIHDFAPTGSIGGNTFIGINSGNFTMTFSSGNDASVNTGVGVNALSSLTTGGGNNALGFNSLASNTTGSNNSAIGQNSLRDNTTGNGNIALGHSALFFNTTGSFNTALGYTTLLNNLTGSENTALGWSSLRFNTASQNTAVGSYSLYLNMTGSENTTIGHKSLYSNSAGIQNTAVGDSALYLNTGSYNTAIGYNAGSNVTTGANLTLLGIDANPSSPTSIDQITLGNIFVTSLRCNVQNISSLSDARDKQNIKELDLGIDFLMKIKPRLYNWDKREWYEDNKSDGSKMKEEPTAGFIAQELDEVQTAENVEWLNLVLKDNPEKLEATPGNLLPVIVKAIQDLKKENDVLKAENVALATRLNKFEKLQNTLVVEIEKLKTNENMVTKVSLGD